MTETKYILILALIGLMGCAVTETVYHPFTPRHSGVWVERDTVVDGETFYYFKNESK